MFYVTSLDGSQVEPLINIGTDFQMEQSVDGTFQVSFSVFPSPNNAGYDLLQSESIVTIDDYDFKIKQFSESAFSKTVVGVSTLFEYSKTRISTIFSGSHSLSNHLHFVLKDTDWTFTVDNKISGSVNYIDKLGNDNIISLINKICKYHSCEFIILPNNRLHFAKQIGGDYDYQYRYKHNVSEVVLKEDTTNLYTYIEGYGAEGLEVSYTSPNVAVFGKLEAEPISDDRFTDSYAFTNYIKSQIQDVPELAIESFIPELTERETGERIWLIYEPLNIEMQTRILKQTKVLRDGKLITDSVVFGNTLIKSSINILVEQQSQINETNETIEDTKDELNETIDEKVREISYRFEETEEIIQDQYTTITNEYKASITANAREIKTEMSQKETALNNRIDAQYTKITSEYNSSITQTAQSIRSEVTASITAVNDNIQNVQQYASSIEQTAQSISSTVTSQQTSINNLGNRVNSAESSITQQANQISQKVSYTDYTGGTITSLINQDPYAVSISASKINLNGAVIVNGTISGATTINVTTDINLGQTLRFSDFTTVSGGGGDIHIDAWNTIYYSASRQQFRGNVDFSNATVTGLNTGGLTATTSTSGGKTYITFRQNGAYLGMVQTV